MTSIAKRVQKHRDKLRSIGLRPLQIWVLDTKRDGFAEECRRQSLLIANDPHEQDVLNWIDNVADTDGWT